LIVCEGSRTEPSYFNRLKKELRLASVEVWVEHGNSAPISVVEHARRLRDRRKRSSTHAPFDRVWCVMDVEDPQPHRSLNEAHDKAQQEKFSLALSNPCFEYWFLLHFERTSRQMTTENAKQFLKEHLPNYDKEVPFDELLAHTETAIANAEGVISEKHYGEDLRNCNPSTHVHRLVLELRGHAKSG